MAFGKDMDAWAGDTGLSLVERNEKKSRFSVSWAEAKLLTIAGVGFLMDAWDLFIINIIYSIILLAYYPKGTKNIDWGLQGGVLKAALVSTLLGAGSEFGSGDDGNLARAFRRGTQDSINRAGEQIVSRELNVRPTLTIRPGFPVRVLVARDLVLGGGQ